MASLLVASIGSFLDRQRASTSRERMSQFLLYYQRPEPATWVYLSSFLTIGLYFVFHRFWSIRNLDVVLLILLGPGLLLVHEGQKLENSLHLRERASSLVSDVEPPSRSEHEMRLTSLNVFQGESTNPRDNSLGETEQLAVDAEKNETLVQAERKQRRGFLWLFMIEGIILLRLLLDPLMVRRPLLDPNLTTGGLVFIGISMLIFLMANVIISTPETQREQGPALGPGYPVLNMLPAIPTTPDSQRSASYNTATLKGPVGRNEDISDVIRSNDDSNPSARSNTGVIYVILARTLAIAAHLAIVIGMAMIGYHHFGNFKAGAGCATLYLLMPYTAQMTGRVDHVLPAALLVWAVLMYRRPLVSGIFLGLAAGLVYYPAFLLPLWFGFYRQRGIGRFACGVAATVAVLTLLLSLGGSENFKQRLIQMYGLWLPWTDNLEGIWGLGWAPYWRIPILVAFILLAGLYSFWPSQKNLGTLMSSSAMLMVAAQFWHGFGGGLFVAWFLPLLLLTVFRPNLEDRVALKVIGGGSASRRSASGRMDISAA